MAWGHVRVIICLPLWHPIWALACVPAAAPYSLAGKATDDGWCPRATAQFWETWKKFQAPASDRLSSLSLINKSLKKENPNNKKQNGD